MPQYAQGIKTDKACMLIALDRMFSPEEWSRDDFHDFFLEFGENGFCNQYDSFLEECAPIKAIGTGMYQVSCTQGDSYVRIINHDTLIRYRVLIHKTVIYCYEVDKDTAHAVAIYADELLFYITHSTHRGLYLPTYGLIIDKVDKLE